MEAQDAGFSKGVPALGADFEFLDCHVDEEADDAGGDEGGHRGHDGADVLGHERPLGSSHHRKGGVDTPTQLIRTPSRTTSAHFIGTPEKKFRDTIYPGTVEDHLFL